MGARGDRKRACCALGKGGWGSRYDITIPLVPGALAGARFNIGGEIFSRQGRVGLDSLVLGPVALVEVLEDHPVALPGRVDGSQVKQTVGGEVLDHRDARGRARHARVRLQGTQQVEDIEVGLDDLQVVHGHLDVEESSVHAVGLAAAVGEDAARQNITHDAAESQQVIAEGHHTELGVDLLDPVEDIAEVPGHLSNNLLDALLLRAAAGEGELCVVAAALHPKVGRAGLGGHGLEQLLKAVPRGPLGACGACHGDVVDLAGVTVALKHSGELRVRDPKVVSPRVPGHHHRACPAGAHGAKHHRDSNSTEHCRFSSRGSLVLLRSIKYRNC
eukprot:Hpha_TRINITY_DN15034_c0_g7::TRINITY_DN15034_c0_g7_i1::g.126176::m.126176